MSERTLQRTVEVDLAEVALWRRRLTWLIPGTFTVSWAVFVLAAEHGDRVLDQWRAALTMVFGSFVAGSTPQGGGAVAFPVFTKVIEIPPAVARTFSLSIQATGMVMASVIILLAGRRIDFTALKIGLAGGSAGFFIGAFALGDRDTVFWSSIIPDPYVKVSFTMAIAMVASIVVLCAGRKFSEQPECDWPPPAVCGLFCFAAVGGVASALTGSGVDVFLFLFVTLVAGVHPRIGIPTSIISMAFVSVLGLVLFGFIDGQLNTTVVDGLVVAVGGQMIAPIPAAQADLFGIWLAAAPIVVWGAPLGSWVASVLPEKVLIRFVAALAASEVVTTVIFLDALHTDRALMLYSAVGLALALTGTRWLAERGASVFGFDSPSTR